MSIFSDYASAVKIVKEARATGRKPGVLRQVPRLPTGYWPETMENALLHDARELYEKVRDVFHGFDVETQHGLACAPNDAGAMLKRARFWQDALKPALTPGEYHEAMRRLLPWYVRCVKLRIATKEAQDAANAVMLAWGLEPLKWTGMRDRARREATA